MPLYLIFYHTRRNLFSHCVMICTFKNLKLLMKQRRGFSDPGLYGNILYTSHDDKPNDMLKSLLKARYDFNLENFESNEVRIF
jgi:hypothetical protein